MKGNLIAVALVVGGAVGSAFAADETETERNDTFAQRQTLAAATRSVSGTLSPKIDFQVDAAVLAAGAVNDHTFTTTAGMEYYAWTDPMISTPYPDLVLGSFDSAGGILDYGDDNGPFNGEGVGGVSSSDGSINLKVSGWADQLFIGDHDESGEYDVFVRLGDDKWVNDVDFFTFTDLLPGSEFTAEIVEGDIDSMLGLYNDFGVRIDFDDDGGDGYLSLLSGVVPDSGKVTLAVTGFEDLAFNGSHYDYGDYVLELSATAVPEPATMLIWVLAGLCGLAVVRGKRLRAAD